MPNNPITSDSLTSTSTRRQQNGSGETATFAGTNEASPPTFKPIEHLAVNRAIFEGNLILKGSRFISDGFMILVRSSLQKPDAEALSTMKHRFPIGRDMDSVTIDDADYSFKQFVSRATIIGKCHGYIERMGERTACVEVAGQIITFDADRVAFVMKYTEASEVKGVKKFPHVFPLVFYKSNKPVAMLMPLQRHPRMEKLLKEVVQDSTLSLLK